MGACTHLFAKIEGMLSEYYGNDAQHQRVMNFLSWLGKNENELSTRLRKDVESGAIEDIKKGESMENLLGFWLGIRYIASVYQKEGETPTFPPIKVGRETSEFNMVEGNFNIERRAAGENPQADLVAGLNLGIHECTHALCIMTGRSEAILPELAVYYNQSRYGLPVKNEDWADMPEKIQAGPDAEAKKKPSGGTHEPWFETVRDVRHLLDSLPKDYFKNEYAEFVFGPWLINALGKDFDIFKLQVSMDALSISALGDLYFMYTNAPSTLEGLFLLSDWRQSFGQHMPGRIIGLEPERNPPLPGLLRRIIGFAPGELGRVGESIRKGEDVAVKGGGNNRYAITLLKVGDAPNELTRTVICRKNQLDPASACAAFGLKPENPCYSRAMEFFAKVAEGLKGKKWENDPPGEREFLAELVKMMNGLFGAPPKADIPKGYSESFGWHDQPILHLVPRKNQA